MEVFIVGGNSSLGKVLKNELSKDSNVYTSGRKAGDYKIDINDPIDNIVLPTNLDAIIITAAHFGGKSESDFYDAVNTNVLGVLKICQAAKKANVKQIIYVSSIFAVLPKTSKNYSVYSLTKKHSEEVLDLYCKIYNLPLVILRPSQLYGNIENFNIRQPFLDTILEKAKKGEEVTFYGSHDAKINLLHIDDLAKIISLVVKNKIVGCYSCTSPIDISYSEFAKLAFEVSNQIENIKFNPNYNDIPDNVFFNSVELFQRIHYFPEVSLKEGIKGIYEFKNKSK